MNENGKWLVVLKHKQSIMSPPPPLNIYVLRTVLFNHPAQSKLNFKHLPESI